MILPNHRQAISINVVEGKVIVTVIDNKLPFNLVGELNDFDRFCNNAVIARGVLDAVGIGLKASAIRHQARSNCIHGDVTGHRTSNSSPPSSFRP